MGIMRRHWLFFMSWTAVFAVGLAGGIAAGELIRDQNGSGLSWLAVETGGSQETVNKPYQLVLARTYLCGVKDEEIKQVPHEQLAQALVAYSGWEIIASDPAKLILYKRENDLAPSCKANGYFGLSPDGVLTLFNGLPAEQQVVQTFYRIDTAKMETKLTKDKLESLKRGIRVRDLAEYNSVLSTYSEFQTDEEES
ncbi:BofC C-terminal domain-containing protein [Brevibacillus sp. NL20B1]|jgi:forespore regulator of the sigma-K checkpoint|uniref:BofC C-terminal domain-containing protein n=2 Tax=Brevibacillus TaxID=55080 RepID=UPI002012EA82|nr:BofC C-terminal domain-containing protein [Brevibacillus sp. NL20B1]